MQSHLSGSGNWRPWIKYKRHRFEFAFILPRLLHKKGYSELEYPFYIAPDLPDPKKYSLRKLLLQHLIFCLLKCMPVDHGMRNCRKDKCSDHVKHRVLF